MRRRGTQWQVDVQLKGIRFRKSYPTHEIAIKAELAARERISLGLPAEPEAIQLKPLTLETLMRQALSRYWEGGRNERTQRTNTRAILSFFGGSTSPRSITSTRVDSFIETCRANGNSTSTINRKLSTLSKALKFALSRDLIDRMPTIERLKENEGRVRYYTDSEITRILGYLDGTEFGDVVIFLLETGARASEAASMLWDDVDLKGKKIRICQTKNGKSRGIPLTNRATEMLSQRQSHLHPSARDNSKVFPGWFDNRCTTTPMSRAWIAAARALCIDGRLHDLRHTFASRLVQRGVSILAVQQLLGHGSVTMTMRYAHLAPDNLREAVEVLNSPVTGIGFCPTRSQI